MTSIFDKGGLYLRDPHGGVEDVQAMKDAGHAWIAFNLGDFSENEWSLVIHRALAAGMPCFPWAYCRSKEDLENLYDSALRHGSRAIFNCEAELRDGGYDIEDVVEAANGLDAALSSEPVPYANISWFKAKHMPMHIQLFPQVSSAGRDPRWCRAQFYLYGMEKVHFMRGIKISDVKAAPRDFPAPVGGSCTYTADDCDQDYRTWAPRPYDGFQMEDVPYSGPYYPQSSGKTPTKGPTVKALKIAMHEAGFGQFSAPDSLFNKNLHDAMIRFQRYMGFTNVTGYYGRGSYEALIALPSARPNWPMALTPGAKSLIESDA